MPDRTQKQLLYFSSDWKYRFVLVTHDSLEVILDNKSSVIDGLPSRAIKSIQRFSEILSDLFRESSRKLSIDDIQSQVSKHFNINSSLKVHRQSKHSC